MAACKPGQWAALVMAALLLWPAGVPPERGWPLLLFNHGYHPNPPDYGRNAHGGNDRPGDYYRGVTQAFVDRGLVVLAPDYRGHNDSEGGDFTERPDAPLYYARDSLAALRVVESLDGLDRSRRYIMGHSMGGLVTLAVLAGVGDVFSAASIWSSMAPAGNIMLPVDAGVPLLVQHARGDRSTPSSGSAAIVHDLQARGITARLELYEGDDHLFAGQDFERAVARDLAWFARPVLPATD